MSIQALGQRVINAIPDDTKKLASDVKRKVIELAKIVYDFIIDNRSKIFFSVTTLLCYVNAPLAAFGYLKYFGYSLGELYVQGFATGAALLALGNMFGMKHINEKADERINYLAGITNICQSLLSPTHGLITSSVTAGIVLAKSTYRYIFDCTEPVRLAYAEDSKGRPLIFEKG
ncbi:MAG: hypothetical protein JXA94_05560 [Parachlamydiales bacterium]|nr:hypothetical protein [Parachlamydiales bacterium]